MFFPATATTSNAQCFKENTAFQSGEKLNFFVYYNMAFIWVDAGKAYFNVDKTTLNGRAAYFFDSYGMSLPMHDWFFKVREHYQTYLDSATLSPIKCERKAIEGSYWVNEFYYFDHEKGKIYSTIENSKQKKKTDSLKLNPCIFDVLTAIYYCRNLDFSKCKINDKIPISMVIDNKEYALYVRYRGKEIMETRDDTKYRCIKFSALLVAGTIFRGGEELTVWVTDDENKIPILIQADILVGSIKVYLSGAEGLKYRLSSKIKY
ncbi:MAG: DUF3108 domain-containing protein [Bacteroidia bacterium]|nr:DUF3108 domain-containing protein [Bacteroidia bacterium]